MKANHPELYERESGQDFEDDDDMDDDLGSSSDDYEDYSSILEPICELRQEDDEQVVTQKPTAEQLTEHDEINETAILNARAMLVEQAVINENASLKEQGLLTEHHLKLQMQLQFELRNHLEKQFNSLIQTVKKDVPVEQPPSLLRTLSLRKLHFVKFNKVFLVTQKNI